MGRRVGGLQLLRQNGHSRDGRWHWRNKNICTATIGCQRVVVGAQLNRLLQRASATSHSIAMITAVRVANRQKGFSTPAHGCFSDWSSCLLTSCCPCVAYGKVAEFSLGVPWYLMCCAITCCNNFHCCLGLASRHELRRKLDIEGNWCEDACVHAFAQPCALCQEVREVDLVNRGERAVGVVNAVPATTYQVQAPEGTVAGQTLQMQTPSGLVACVVPAGVAAGDVFNIQVNAPVVDAQPAAQAMDIEMEGLSKPLMV